MKKVPAVERFGQRFGRLVVLPEPPEIRVSPKGSRFAYMTVRCDCGTVFKTYLGRLTCSKVFSCGCLGRERSSERYKARNTTHGLAGTKTYKIWKGIVSRCTVPSASGYYRYGARGIKVCERWRKFENFIDDMGECPEGMSIDRIDNNGDYAPENCKWASIVEQSRNRCSNVFVVVEGKRMTLSEMSERLGFSYRKLYYFMHRHGVAHQAALDMLLTRKQGETA